MDVLSVLFPLLDTRTCDILLLVEPTLVSNSKLWYQRLNEQISHPSTFLCGEIMDPLKRAILSKNQVHITSLCLDRHLSRGDSFEERLPAFNTLRTFWLTRIETYARGRHVQVLRDLLNKALVATYGSETSMVTCPTCNGQVAFGYMEDDTRCIDCPVATTIGTCAKIVRLGREERARKRTSSCPSSSLSFSSSSSSSSFSPSPHSEWRTLQIVTPMEVCM
jgi:hypothetical protein